jgi:predicted cupin superfamily sugar epimerase
MTAAEVKKLLNLVPHPQEGGWYVRTWESGELLAPEAFADARYDGPRHTSTAIYYLLEPDTFSEMHVLQSDEIFHHYLGDAVEMLQLYADGSSEHIIFGKDIAAGQRLQTVVRRNIWQGSRLAPLGSGLPKPEGWALLGCTVSPGFEFVDYKTAPRAELIAKWPNEAELIAKLTNS